MGMQKVSGAELQKMIEAGKLVGVAGVAVYGEGVQPQGTAVPTAAAARQMTDARLKLMEDAQELKELFEDTELALMEPIAEQAAAGYDYHAAIIDDKMVDKFVPQLKAAGYKVLTLPPTCDGCRQLPADIRDEVRDEMCDEIRNADVGTETLVVVRW